MNELKDATNIQTVWGKKIKLVQIRNTSKY